jgi:hypothetical protein
MTDTVALIIAAVGAVAGPAGIVIGSYLTERQTDRSEERAERRARQAAAAAWQQARIRDTRLGLRRQLAQIEASALGHLEDAARHALAIEDLDIDITLVGDLDAVRAYRALVVELRGRFGKGLPPGYPARAAKALGGVLGALDAQEERLLRGDPVIRIRPVDAPEFFSPESLAERLDLPWQLPTFSAILGRAGVDLLLWMERRWPKRRRHDGRPRR